jgi:predicted porin
VQIKKFALLSADYEFVDYSTARFSQSGDGYDYSEKNQAIKNSLKSASNIRVGGEVRLNSLYLRAGYAYYGKVFQDNPDEENANLDYNSVSFGIGYRVQNVSLDFAYTNYNYSQKNVLYPLYTGFDPAIANINTAKNMFTMTLAYKFGY